MQCKGFVRSLIKIGQISVVILGGPLLNFMQRVLLIRLSFAAKLIQGYRQLSGVVHLRFSRSGEAIPPVQPVSLPTLNVDSGDVWGNVWSET